MKLTLAFAVLAILLFSFDSARACSCGGAPTTCGSYEAADAVLIGTVIRVENKAVKSEDGVEYIAGQTAYVQVDEAFKGVKSPEMIFRSFGTSCDPQYGAGQRWLFYAYYGKDSNTWSIRACDRSTQLAWAADDLLYLRALPQSAQRTRIAGRLWNRDNTPLIGVKVKLTLIDGLSTQEVFTDKNGVYEAYDLPPGRYNIEPETPLNLKLSHTSKSLITDRDRRAHQVEIRAKSCAVMNFYYTEDTLVSGRVFGADGQPMPDVCVHLVFKDKPKDTPYLGDCTDENGRFKIDDVLLGEYFLIANEDGKITSDEPFPTAYYPGVFEKEKATTLTFSSGDRLQDFDIHIPSQKSLRTIEGKLLFSDGRPAAGDSVKFVPEGMNDNMDAQVVVEADSEGRFRLRVLEGLKGTVIGYMFRYSGQVQNCPKLEAIIKARKEIVTNKINVELNRDHQDLELVFPFPYCKKAKE
jgi:hypothetical protein